MFIRVYGQELKLSPDRHFTFQDSMLPIASLVLAAALSSNAPASMTPAPRQAPAPAVATPTPAAAGDVAGSHNASDLDTLRPLVGKTVEITGTPTATGKSKSGNVLYLNFAGAHQAVALVLFLEAGAGEAGADSGAKKAASEDDLKPFVGKAVSVKGKLADYKGDLQIVIDSMDQIKVATP